MNLNIQCSVPKNNVEMLCKNLLNSKTEEDVTKFIVDLEKLSIENKIKVIDILNKNINQLGILYRDEVIYVYQLSTILYVLENANNLNIFKNNIYFNENFKIKILSYDYLPNWFKDQIQMERTEEICKPIFSLNNVDDKSVSELCKQLTTEDDKENAIEILLKDPKFISQITLPIVFYELLEFFKNTKNFKNFIKVMFNIIIKKNDITQLKHFLDIVLIVELPDYIKILGIFFKTKNADSFIENLKKIKKEEDKFEIIEILYNNTSYLEKLTDNQLVSMIFNLSKCYNISILIEHLIKNEVISEIISKNPMLLNIVQQINSIKKPKHLDNVVKICNELFNTDKNDNTHNIQQFILNLEKLSNNEKIQIVEILNQKDKIDNLEKMCQDNSLTSDGLYTILCFYLNNVENLNIFLKNLYDNRNIQQKIQSNRELFAWVKEKLNIISQSVILDKENPYLNNVNKSTINNKYNK